MRPSIYGGIPQRDDLRPLTEALHARDCDRVQRELQERLGTVLTRTLAGVGAAKLGHCGAARGRAAWPSLILPPVATDGT